jgi:hypothetical protein
MDGPNPGSFPQFPFKRQKELSKFLPEKGFCMAKEVFRVTFFDPPLPNHKFAHESS